MAGGTSGLQVPHYHKHGFDFFVMLQGCGWLHTADVEDGQISAAGWRHQRLERGDSYSIEPNKAHPPVSAKKYACTKEITRGYNR